jgi:Zinc finger, C3HC4 type (RING finger)
MRHYIGPFNEVFREALTVRREASILRGWAMPWNEDVPLPGCAPRDQNQERTAMLRRQLQSHDQEIPRAFMQQNNEPNNPLDPGPVGLAIYVMNDNHDIVQGQVEGVAVRILGYKSVPLPTANECGVCKDVGASVAVVGCGCVCICRNCSDNGSLPLKACPMCRGGTKDRNGCLILQRLH